MEYVSRAFLYQILQCSADFLSFFLYLYFCIIIIINNYICKAISKFKMLLNLLLIIIANQIMTIWIKS
jgi:hypothetical protein